MKAYKVNSLDPKGVISILLSSKKRFCIDTISKLILFEGIDCALKEDPTFDELSRAPADPECRELRERLIPVSYATRRYETTCNPNVVQLLERRIRLRGREQVDTARGIEVVPRAVICVDTSNWTVWAQCRNDKIQTFFAKKQRVNATQIQDLLMAALSDDTLNGFRYPFDKAFRGAGFVGPIAVFGGSGAGKTYFLRRLPDILS
ncbi:MAG: hypothetical protein ACP5I3_12120, partial [Thermoproteus sp.]